MMMNKLALLLTLFLIGCDISGEPIHNSPSTDRVLDHFAGGLRFGDSFEAAEEKGSVIDSRLDESGSTMRLEFSAAKYGFSNVRLLGTATSPGHPELSRIYRVILFSRSDSAQIALTSAKEAAMRIFGDSGKEGCIGYGEQRAGVVTVWETESGGGLALLAPLRVSISTDEALTRIIVYPRGRKAVHVLPGFRTSNCPDPSGSNVPPSM